MSEQSKTFFDDSEDYKAKWGKINDPCDPLSHSSQMKRMADKGWLEFEAKAHAICENSKRELDQKLKDLDRKIHELFDRRKS